MQRDVRLLGRAAFSATKFRFVRRWHANGHPPSAIRFKDYFKDWNITIVLYCLGGYGAPDDPAAVLRLKGQRLSGANEGSV